MKNNFLKKLTALLLGTIMVLSMIPAIAIGTKAAETEMTVTLNIEDYATANELTSGKQYNTITMDGGITVTATGGTNTGKYYYGSSYGHQWRIYQNENPLIVVNGNGATIVSVKITYKIDKTGILTHNGNDIDSEKVVTVNAATATFGVGNTGTATNGQVRITEIEVVYITSGSSGGDEPTCEHTNTVPVGEAKEASCTETGMTAGEKCDDCDEIVEAQETIPLVPHNYVNNVCSVCGADKPVLPTFEKVTSTLDVIDGTYLIVYETGKIAFNGALTTLDVGKNGIEVNLVDKTITGDYRDYVFYIKKSGNSYTIKSASGYYIGRTANSNGINTSTDPELTNSIEIDSSENAVIKSSNGRYLRYNSSNGDNNLRFRYYGSGQQAIALYKLVEATEPEQPEEVEAPTFTSALVLNKGISLRVKFNVTAEWLEAHKGATINVDGEVVISELVEGENVYTIDLTPGQIGTEFTVTCGDVEKKASVSKYISNVKNKDAAYFGYSDDKFAKLTTLLNAIEIYGDIVSGKNEGDVITTEFSSEDSFDVDDTNNVFAGFSATLGYNVDFSIGIDAEKATNFKIALGGRSASGLLADVLDENGKLVVENLRPANYDDTIEVTIFNENETVATARFTFNAYLKILNNNYEEGSDISNLIAAVKNYGDAAIAFSKAQ